MKAKALLAELMVVVLLLGASVPLAAQAPEKFPVTMLVYRDGTVEFTSDYAQTGVEPYEGLSSVSSRFSVTPTAGGSKLELTLRAIFEGPLLEQIATVCHQFNFGIRIYPNATMLLDLLLQFEANGYEQYIMEAEDYVVITEITANAEVVGEMTDVQMFMKLMPGQTYTVQEMITSIAENEAYIQQMVSLILGQIGFQITRFELTPTPFSADTVLLRVDVGLQGNLTQVASEFTGGMPGEVVFSPILILGAFVAPPDQVSKITFNLSDAGTFDAALTLNYGQGYDAIINANRLNYLNEIEAIANQDPVNGAPWLLLISVLKPALLTASQAGYSFSVDYADSRVTWSGKFPKMKVGQVSDSTVSLKQFLRSLGPLYNYTRDADGNPNLRIAIRGVEDAAGYMDIVVPPGTPSPTSHPNASTAIWEGVYLDQLQDVSFTIRLKDNVSPTITSGVAPGAALSEKRPHLTATLSDNVAIDVLTIMIKVDGVDVTSSATTSATSVSYTPASDLQDGPHTFYVKVEDTAGNPAELTVSFTVSSGIPMVYLLGGGAVLVVVIGAAAFFLLRKKPSAAQGPPPPPPA
jgi:hypothetical protein